MSLAQVGPLLCGESAHYSTVRKFAGLHSFMNNQSLLVHACFSNIVRSLRVTLSISRAWLLIYPLLRLALRWLIPLVGRLSVDAFGRILPFATQVQ